MKPLQTSKSTPAWQTEHSAIALRACLRVKAAIARGETFTRALQIVSRYYHGRPYSCEPSRRLKLAPKTLMGIYYLWQGNDENPAALKLNYKKAAALCSPWTDDPIPTVLRDETIQIG